MGWVAFVAGAAAIGALIAATVVLVTHGLRLYRATQTFSRDLSPRLEHISAGAETAAGKAEQLENRTAELQTALAHFSVSRARLNVLVAAAQDVRASVSRLTEVLPKK